MKTIIAGSRDIEEYEYVEQACRDCGWDVTSVVSGTARGADLLGEEYALKHELQLFQFPADWNKHGRAAGHIRNAEMANNADALIALWDGKSRGTENMINVARKKGLQVYVKMVTV